MSVRKSQSDGTKASGAGDARAPLPGHGSVNSASHLDAGNTSPSGLTHKEVLTAFGGLLIALFLAALGSTVVSTALPTMAGELGSVDQLPWILTAYLLTTTASTPLWGKFSDLWGRRRLFEIAIVWYLVASALTGASQDMTQLVIGRAIQGIGSGGITSLTFVIIGDLVSPRERGRYIGWFTSVFTSAALIGPLIGGFFVDGLHWRWIFYFNLPVGLVAWAIVHRVLRMPVPTVKRRVDVEGAVLLVVAVTALILVMTWGGDRSPWTSPTILGLSALALVSTAALVRQEFKAAEPMIPPRIFRSKVVTFAVLMSLAAGASMIAANAFLPLFLQVVGNTSATESGLALAPLMVMMTGGSIVAGNLMTRLGRYKVFIVAGPALILAASVALTQIDNETGTFGLLPWLVVMGIGMGFVMPTATTIAQNALPMSDMGAGTATITFARNLGQTIAVGAYGAALAARMGNVLAERLPSDADFDANELLSSPSQIRLLPDEMRSIVIDSVVAGTKSVFVIAAPVAIIMLLFGLLLPEVPLKTWPSDESNVADGSRTTDRLVPPPSATQVVPGVQGGMESS